MVIEGEDTGGGDEDVVEGGAVRDARAGVAEVDVVEEVGGGGDGGGAFGDAGGGPGGGVGGADAVGGREEPAEGDGATDEGEEVEVGAADDDAVVEAAGDVEGGGALDTGEAGGVERGEEVNDGASIGAVGEGLERVLVLEEGVDGAVVVLEEEGAGEVGGSAELGSAGAKAAGLAEVNVVVEGDGVVGGRGALEDAGVVSAGGVEGAGGLSDGSGGEGQDCGGGERDHENLHRARAMRSRPTRL